MSRRRSMEAGDPMELLLDTVSNIFGGVMFLTLLAILLIMNRGGALLGQPTNADPSDRNFDIEFAQLQSKINELDFALEAQSRTISTLIPSGDIEAQLEEFEQIQQQIVQLQRQVEQTEKQIEDQETQNEQREASREELEKQRDQKKIEVESKLADLEKASQKASRQVTFSLLREALTREIVLLLRYGKLYRLTNSEDKDDICTEDITVEDTFLSKTYQPRPNAGETVSQYSLTRTRTYLNMYPPQRYHVTVAVWDDSFAEFNILRDELVKSGYPYRTMICNDETILTLGGTSGFVQ